MNATSLPKSKRKYYSLAEANATLPLVRSILRDVTGLANELGERYERLSRLKQTDGLDQQHQEEVQQLLEDFERGQDRMRELVLELEKLHIELKNEYTGLIDFRHWKDGREVYLCWQLGEPEVSHWHELDAGFAGRKRITDEVLNG